jgi:hypothetical protein
MNIIRERVYKYKQISSKVQPTLQEPKFQVLPYQTDETLRVSPSLKKPPSIVDMSLEQTIGNLEIRYANVVTFVGSSNTMVDTTTGRIQTKGFQHNSNVITDVSGPHGRVAPTLKKYPEIAFADGKFDSNESTNTYVQAGYTVSASTTYSTHRAFKAFNGVPNDFFHWQSGSFSNSDGTYSGGTQLFESIPGEWLKIEVPNKIKPASINLYRRDFDGQSPKDFKIYASITGSSWTLLTEQTGIDNWTNAAKSYNFDTGIYYKYFAILVTKITRTNSAGAQTSGTLGELEIYGYEEDPPAGDHSVDTTFKSRFNNPQLTGVQVLVDGATGVGTNHISGGPDPSGNQATMTLPNKYWTLNGTLTSNLSVEANTFLEGDQPHAVSVWFNSSNLEANVSNTCVFSIASEEKLDSVNLDLQSNTWHNLTYAYQGEGGSRVTYLDGRKVAEDQAEDTFGEYPPFEIGTYSLGGYTVDASYWNMGGTNREAFNIFRATGGGRVTGFHTDSGNYVLNPADANYDATLMTLTDTSGTAHLGHWVSLELPHKLSPSYCEFEHYGNTTSYRLKDFVILGSNYDPKMIKTGFTLLFSGQAHVDNNGTNKTSHVFTGSGKFKYLILLTKTLNSANSTWIINRLRYYGHRENDLVRLPDPTNVLKYPHIVMTGYAQRGYVVSATAESNDGTYNSWEAFDGVKTGGSTASDYQSTNISAWMPNYPTGGDFDINGDATTQTQFNPGGGAVLVDGPALIIQFPHKVRVTSYNVYARAANDIAYAYANKPKSGRIYGSDDGLTWTQIDSFGDWTTWVANTPQTEAITTPDAYNRYAIVVESMTYQSQTWVAIGEWELYGTGVDSIPIQIGGGNIDRVANFRVYDKFIGEDQVNEIWNAQKEEFGRAKPQMVLQQGKLGIGTDAPQGSLSVADEPDPTTYGFQEFPPKPLAGYKTFFEGHGEFCVSVSSFHSDTYAGWKAFDKGYTSTGGEGVSTWISGYDPIAYNSSGVATGSFGVINGVNGEYLILESPYKIKLEHVLIYPRAHTTTTFSYSLPPKDGKIWGRNAIDEPWTEITSYANLTYGATRADNLYGQNPTRVNINATQYYKYIAFQITATNTSYGGSVTYTNYTNLKELRYFGYREQLPPKQSVLHDGQLTLTKSLTVPRIGPALDADDTPRRDRLVVEYNTSTNPTFEGAVRDTSGRGNDGVFRGSSYDASAKAFEFDGSNDYTRSGILTNMSGDKTVSYSLWINADTLVNTMIVALGEAGVYGTNGKTGGIFMDSIGTLYNTVFGNGIQVSGAITIGNWIHIVATKVPGGSGIDTQTLYVNGLKPSQSNWGTPGTSLSLDDPVITLGASPTLSQHFNGSISNFKLYDVALTAEEVKTLYDMGRCDEGGHVVNFSKTRVGIGLGDGEAPRSALDVRDKIYAESSSVQTFTGQHICFPDESMEKGLIVSAKKNKFVKLNGLATGKSAITIDESLPIVSLSNVSQDKACFGVVSKMEESNAAYRTEITGGLVSESIKIVGDNRAIVNSVGEGAIWVVDTNGPLESGDYITTSNVAGYGQKQDSEFLANYSVAKITMDCDFTASNVAVQTIKREQTGTQIITEDAWNQLVEYDRYSNVEDEITTYYQIQRGGNVLDENGQLQFEDKTGATEEPYERRFLTTDGTQTDEANAVHIAAFVGCTYHCG